MKFYEIDTTKNAKYKGSDGEVWEYKTGWGEIRHETKDLPLFDAFRFNHKGLMQLEFEEIKPKIKVLWEKVPVDARVLVWDAVEIMKVKRYFAHVSDGQFYCFESGRTSYTTQREGVWNYCEVHESEIQRGLEEGWVVYE